MPDPSNKLLLGRSWKSAFVSPVIWNLVAPALAAVFGPKPIGFTGSYTPAVAFTGSFTPSIGFEKVG